jgi:hypothetical protein
LDVDVCATGSCGPVSMYLFIVPRARDLEEGWCEVSDCE